MIYPLTVEAAAARESPADSAARLQALDSRLDGLMAVVRLQYLVSREGGWDAQAEWGETLSLGAPWKGFLLQSLAGHAVAIGSTKVVASLPWLNG